MYYRNDLSFEYVNDLLTYDPETGVFRWKRARGYTFKAGSLAGYKHNGYWWIQTGGKRYAAHRLAWLLMTGEWPEEQIDHRDMNRGNNCWNNLRAATRSQNNANRGRVPGAPLKGVTRSPRCVTKPWVAQIKPIGGKHRGLGYYATQEEAHEAYLKAAAELFGEYHRGE